MYYFYINHLMPGVPEKAMHTLANLQLKVVWLGMYGLLVDTTH